LSNSSTTDHIDLFARTRYFLRIPHRKHSMNMLNRRTFVQRAGLAGASLLGLTFGARRAVADPDPPPASPGTAANTAAASSEPDVFTLPFGGEDAFVIHDGALSMPGIQPMFAPEAKKEQIESLLKESSLPSDHIALSINVLVLKSPSGVALFDAGAGSAFGPTTGKLLRGLARIGVPPSDVKSIYVTHAHPDHICGLVDASSNPVFPSAKILADKTEVDFWTSEHPDLSGMKVPAEMRSQSLGTIQKTLDALKSSLELKSPGRLSPEVELIAAPGHTPGHSFFKVSRGGDTLLVMGDVVHSFALQFPHPEWTMAFDTVPAQAIKTRRKLFKDAAAEQTTLLGAHMPFPGIGHVRVAGSGYQWVPRPWVI
jgi:glyoxylase-like metal-dependent hydrolase (beta-lactamase superfamily II)